MTKILWELAIVCTVFRFWSLKSSVQGMLSSCGVVSLVVQNLFVVSVTVPQKFAFQDVFVYAI